MRTLLLILLCLAPSLADAQVVVWGNRTYTSRVCSNPRCAMCASIQAQLHRSANTKPNTNNIYSTSIERKAEAAAQVTSEMEAYTVAIKTGCVNGICTFRYETRYRPRVAAKVARLETRSANAMRRVAYTVQVPVTKKVCIGKDSQGRCIFGDVTTYETRIEYKMVPVEEPQASVEQPSDARYVSTEVEQAPTPHEAVAALMGLIKPSEKDVLYDLGSGDGRIVIAATLAGCRGVGIELDRDSVETAREAATIFGVDGHTKFYNGDILDYDLSGCQLVTMYLYPDLMEQVAEKLPPGCVVWTYMHGLLGAKKYEVDGYEFYEWIKQ